MALKYKVSKKRMKARQDAGLNTGMRVMAVGIDGVFNKYDIYDLDLPSLRNWLRQHGGDNPFAETAFAISMGHSREHCQQVWSDEKEEAQKVQEVDGE